MRLELLATRPDPTVDGGDPYDRIVQLLVHGEHDRSILDALTRPRYVFDGSVGKQSPGVVVVGYESVVICARQPPTQQSYQHDTRYGHDGFLRYVEQFNGTVSICFLNHFNMLGTD